MAVLIDEVTCAAARVTSSNSIAFDWRDTARPLVLLVEGSHDIEFLRRIGHVVRHANPRVPDLAQMEQQGSLVFLPQGGGEIAAWADRLIPLRCPQVYLFDRECGEATPGRLRTAERINRRAGCRAFVTRKRALENFLHPSAIFDARQLNVEFDDQDDVAVLVARRQWEKHHPTLPWSQLTARARYRLRAKSKQWLNTLAVEQMTIERLAERDPDWEILSWFEAVAELAE